MMRASRRLPIKRESPHMEGLLAPIARAPASTKGQ
jgi:hypothetical protein